MLESWITGHEISLIIKLLLCLVIGYAIGAEREHRGKVAGISTHCFVIGGSMLFTYLSLFIDPNSPARIAAQIITGIGFLGAGIILKEKNDKIVNVTTAANIWFSAAIGMAIGFDWYLIAIIAGIYAIFVPLIPHIEHKPIPEQKNKK